MITFLYDIEDNLISDLINTAILEPEIIKIKNKLLDGTYHIQSIGSALTIIGITCYVKKTNKEKIDDLYINDEPVKLTKEGKYYIGLISDKPVWSVFTKGTYGLYETKFKIAVSEEGSI